MDPPPAVAPPPAALAPIPNSALFSASAPLPPPTLDPLPAATPPPAPLPPPATEEGGEGEKEEKEEKKGDEGEGGGEGEKKEEKHEEKKEGEGEGEEEGEEAKQKREKMGRMRHNAAMEILTSEETYLTSLMLVREMFLKPFEEGCEDSRPMLTKAEVGMYFGSLNVIISFSKALFTQLRASISPLQDGDSLRLSSVFTSFVAFLKVYKQYTDTYETSTQELYKRVNERPQLKKFIEEAQNKPESKGLSLFDFLIMPVQRVPRYCLLLREVIRFTPEKHEDHNALKDALGKIQNLAGEINESKRIMEQKVNFLKVQSRLGLPSGWPLAPHRVYETETNAVIVDENHGAFPCTLFLFNDILLLCSVVRQSLTLSRSYELKGASTTPFPVADVPQDAMQMREKKPPKATPRKEGSGVGTAGAAAKKKPKLQRRKSMVGKFSLKDDRSLSHGADAEEECALRLVLPHEQSVVVVFDGTIARDQFQESFDKSLAYCDSRRLRALEAGALEFKAKEQFSAVGQKKFKGSTYSQSFIGSDFVDWVEKLEGCDRERATRIGQSLVENGVVLPCEIKKSHGEFHDKPFPYRFIWHSRELQLVALKDAGKKSYNKVTIHLVGYKGSPSFVRARRTITQLKNEYDGKEEGKVSAFSSEFEEEADFYDWLCEKRQSLGTVVPAARYHSSDHIVWVTYDRIEYFLGEYTDMLLIFSETQGLQGDTLKIALKQAQL